jgi:hypothetical protein
MVEEELEDDLLVAIPGLEVREERNPVAVVCVPIVSVGRVV